MKKKFVVEKRLIATIETCLRFVLLSLCSCWLVAILRCSSHWLNCKKRKWCHHQTKVKLTQICFSGKLYVLDRKPESKDQKQVKWAQHKSPKEPTMSSQVVVLTKLDSAYVVCSSGKYVKRRIDAQ